MSLSLAAEYSNPIGSFELLRREPLPPFGAVKTLEVVAAEQEGAVKTDAMIRQIEVASSRVFDMYERLKRHDGIVTTLRTRIAELERSNDKAAEAASLNALRAETAEQKLAELDGEHAVQSRDLQRLKANIDRLMAIFAAAPDAAAAHN